MKSLDRLPDGIQVAGIFISVFLVCVLFAYGINAIFPPAERTNVQATDVGEIRMFCIPEARVVCFLSDVYRGDALSCLPYKDVYTSPSMTIPNVCAERDND